MIDFDKEHLPFGASEQVRAILEHNAESLDMLPGVSAVYWQFCKWVRSVTLWHQKWCELEPLRTSIAMNQAELQSAQIRDEALRSSCEELQIEQARLFEEATPARS